MIYRNAIVLVTLAVSSNAFWFNSDAKPEPQPTVKHVPFGYFRGKMLTPNSVYNYQKALPGQPGLPPSPYGPPHSIPQPPNTQSVPSAMTPTNVVPTSQTSTNPASVNPTLSTTATQSQPPLNDVQPPTAVPAQFTSNPHVINNSPLRQTPFVPDPVNLQYMTNVAALPLQHVQFVPCMCPVAVSISTGISTPDIIANKRSDDIQLPADYRDTSIVEQSLTEER